MNPKIETLKSKKLIGKCLKTNLIENKTTILWKSFIQQRHEIKNTNGTDLYSIQLYSKDYFKKFNPANVFEKWAAIEVKDFKNIPSKMQTFILPAGLYAVFFYKGLNTDTSIFEYIYNEWIPNSNYVLDNKPHFEVLGKNYKNNDSQSEELIYIPIKTK